MQKVKYYPQLDSIRGISFLAIFIYHAFHPLPGGLLLPDFIFFVHSKLHFALDAFFVLSSFLLTWLGLNEYKRKGSFSFKNYFIRRVLRIWPLYYLIMIFSFAVLPAVKEAFNIQMSLPPPSWYLFFVANFYTVDHVYFLRFLWTLSVEEQFYLVLGACLKFFSKYLIYIFIGLTLISIAYSVCANYYAFFDSYQNTLAYFFDFAAGGMAAIVIFKNAGLARLLEGLTKIKTIIFYNYLPLHFILFYWVYRVRSFSEYSEHIDLLNRYLFVIYIALLLIEQMVNLQRTRFLERSRSLVFTGRISFGLYCFHGITLTFVQALFPAINSLPGLLSVILIFAINYGISVISFYYFETPFLRLKQRFRKA